MKYFLKYGKVIFLVTIYHSMNIVVCSIEGSSKPAPRCATNGRSPAVYHGPGTTTILCMYTQDLWNVEMVKRGVYNQDIKLSTSL